MKTYCRICIAHSQHIPLRYAWGIRASFARSRTWAIVSPVWKSAVSEHQSVAFHSTNREHIRMMSRYEFCGGRPSLPRRVAVQHSLRPLPQLAVRRHWAEARAPVEPGDQPPALPEGECCVACASSLVKFAHALKERAAFL